MEWGLFSNDLFFCSFFEDFCQQFLFIFLVDILVSFGRYGLVTLKSCKFHIFLSLSLFVLLMRLILVSYFLVASVYTKSLGRVLQTIAPERKKEINGVLYLSRPLEPVDSYNKTLYCTL